VHIHQQTAEAALIPGIERRGCHSRTKIRRRVLLKHDPPFKKNQQ
jgi:hypothetical protein